MASTETTDAKIFTWVVATLMVVLICYGMLTIVGVLR
jgi:hypothetical protein